MRRALEVRKQMTEAGVDPKLWDRALAAELATVDHPLWRAVHRTTTLLAVLMGELFALALLFAAISESTRPWANRVGWAVNSGLALFAGIVSALALIAHLRRAGRQLNGPLKALSDIVERREWLSLEAPYEFFRSERRGSTAMRRPSRRTRRAWRREAARQRQGGWITRR